ncbi:MAG TPA: hypothetical protein VFZ61_03700 [Polyangiales bacterium]
MARNGKAHRWYEYSAEDAHEGVCAEVKRIRLQQSEQRRDMVHFMELYAAGNVSGLGRTMPRDRLLDYVFGFGGGETRFNMAGAIVDTAISMCAQTPAVPVYLTTGGDFGLMRKARKKSQVLQGQMNELGAPVATRMFEDCAKVGTGFAHGYIDHVDGLPKVENVHPLEMLIEHADGMYKLPRLMIRQRIVAKEELKAQYPGNDYAIDKAPKPDSDAVNDFFLSQMGTESAEDFVEVFEAHRLCTGKRRGNGKGAKLERNGVHLICIHGKTLMYEKHAEREHPYEALRYRERDFGFFGSGLVESCRENQNRVNELIARVQRGQDLASNVVVFNPKGQGITPVKKSQFTNDICVIIEYDHLAGPPQLAKWDGTQWDLQQQIDKEFERALLVEGLSAEQTNGEGAGKGLTSGVAVRAADDVQTRRLVSPIKRFQEACIGVSKLIARLNDQLAERDPEYAVSGRVTQGRSTFLQTSTWAELEIPEGHAQIEMMPMSALPTTPQGKWAAVMEWIQAGFVSQQYAMQLLQFPDLDSYADTELAHIDLAQWQVEQILDGEMPFPVPRQDLRVAIDIATKSQLKAITMKAPTDVVDAFELFLQWCEQMQDEAAAEVARKQAAMAPPAPQMMAGGPPPGALPAGAPGPAALVQQPPARPALAAVV